MPTVQSQKRGLMYAAGAVALYFLLRGINFANNVDFIPKKIRLGGSFFYPEVYITFTVINPTDLSVTVTNIMGDIVCNGQEVASVSSVDTLQVTGHQAIDLEIKALAKISDVFTVIGNALKGNIKDVLFDGSVDLNGVRWPIKKSLA